jgi:tetratricopeptide (TPR) repeat protein
VAGDEEDGRHRHSDPLQGVLMARIDRLEEEARRVLQMASVVGRIFLYRVLEAIAEEGQALDEQLSTLQREEMIRERARVPELEYIFKHHLTQEAAYNGLLRRERRLFHRQVAEALQELFPDRIEEQFGLLAHHWEQAGERKRAIGYLRRAAEQAAAQFANAEAIGYFARALDLTPVEDLVQRYDLLQARERVYYLQGAREAQHQDLAALEKLAQALNDVHRQAEVALRQARCAYLSADYPVAIAAAQESVHLAQTAGDVRREATGYLEWGQTLRFQGEFGPSRPLHEKALTLARAAHFHQLEAECLRSLGVNFLDQGDYAAARACLEQSLHIYPELSDRRGDSHTRLWLGFTALAQGDYDEARTLYEQAVRVLREIGDRWSEAFAHLLPGRVDHGLGKYDGAKAHYEQCMQRCREMDDRRGEAIVLSQLGLLYHHLGDHETARECAQQGLKMARDQGGRVYQGPMLICLGHALAGLVSLDEANETYGEALALLRESGQTHLAMDALAGLARVCLVQGDPSEAQDHVEEIMSYLQGHTLGGGGILLAEPARVYLTCYRVLEANGDPRAQDVLEEAYRFLQERAAKISDKGERQSFLENVAANREIASEYALVGSTRKGGRAVNE